MRFAREPDFDDWSRPGRGLRPRPPPHAERRGVLRAPVGDTRSSRLHRQQRLPDRASPARVLPAHAGARDGVGVGDARTTSAPAARRLQGLRRAELLQPDERHDTCPLAVRSAIESDSAGLTRSAELSQLRLLADDGDARRRPVPRRSARPGPAAGRSPRPELVAADARRGVVGRAARDAARQRGRAVRAERPPQAPAGACTGARSAHRQRVGDGGPVLPTVQDHSPPAHEHGKGRAEHDDPHVGGGLRRPTGST